MDAYTAVKILSLDHGCTAFQIVANMATNEAAAAMCSARFHDVSSRFLTCEMDFLGSIPHDRHMREAVLHQGACVSAYPHSPAALAFARIATRISDKNIMTSPGGNRFLGQEP